MLRVAAAYGAMAFVAAQVADIAFPALSLPGLDAHPGHRPPGSIGTHMVERLCQKS